MSQRFLRITALILLIAAIGVVWTFIVLEFIARKGIHVLGPHGRPLTPDAKVTELTVEMGEVRFALTAVTLPRTKYLARLMDNAGRDREHTALRNGFGDGVVAINVGYFDEHFEPVGLCVIDGREVSPVSPRSPLSAVIAIDAAGQLHLLPTGEYKPGFVAAIQAGPFIIDPGRSIGVTEAASARANRTVVAQTARGDVVVITTSGASLFELAKVLKDAPRVIGCDAIERAVNLDGGPSTTMLLKGEPGIRKSGGPVRNYLIFSPAK